MLSVGVFVIMLSAVILNVAAPLATFKMSFVAGRGSCLIDKARGQCYKTFLYVIYKDRVFVILDWKSLLMTNTLANYEKP
jgi:hypothetical protein